MQKGLTYFKGILIFKSFITITFHTAYRLPYTDEKAGLITDRGCYDPKSGINPASRLTYSHGRFRQHLRSLVSLSELLNQRFQYRPEQNGGADQKNDAGNRSCHNAHGRLKQGISRRDSEGAAQVGLANNAEHQPENHRGAVEFAGDEDKADQTGNRHQNNVNRCILGSVRADGSHHNDGRPQNAVGDFQNLDKYFRNDYRRKHHDYIRDKHGGKGGGQELRLIDKQQRTHGHAFEHQRGHHDCRRVAAGDTKGKQRNH